VIVSRGGALVKVWVFCPFFLLNIMIRSSPVCLRKKKLKGVQFNATCKGVNVATEFHRLITTQYILLLVIHV
jgi:hypothetical protein